MNGNVEQTWAVSHAPIGSVTLANMEIQCSSKNKNQMWMV